MPVCVYALFAGSLCFVLKFWLDKTLKPGKSDVSAPIQCASTVEMDLYVILSSVLFHAAKGFNFLGFFLLRNYVNLYSWTTFTTCNFCLLSGLNCVELDDLCRSISSLQFCTELVIKSHFFLLVFLVWFCI